MWLFAAASWDIAIRRSTRAQTGKLGDWEQTATSAVDFKACTMSRGLSAERGRNKERLLPLEFPPRNDTRLRYELRLVEPHWVCTVALQTIERVLPVPGPWTAGTVSPALLCLPSGNLYPCIVAPRQSKNIIHAISSPDGAVPKTQTCLGPTDDEC